MTKKKGEGKKKGAAPFEPPAAELPPSVAAFEKCDIRVSQILTCAIPDYSEKLLVLTIDIGVVKRVSLLQESPNTTLQRSSSASES